MHHCLRGMDFSGVLYSSMACKRLLVDPLTRNSFGWIAACRRLAVLEFPELSRLFLHLTFLLTARYIGVMQNLYYQLRQLRVVSRSLIHNAIGSCSLICHKSY